MPDSILRELERLAYERRQTVSSLAAGLLQKALKDIGDGPERRDRILQRWKRAFVPVTLEEQLLVDGIVLDEPLVTAK